MSLWVDLYLLLRKRLVTPRHRCVAFRSSVNLCATAVFNQKRSEFTKTQIAEINGYAL
jgi:hypothetical protein